jgi:hypothetical protein
MKYVDDFFHSVEKQQAVQSNFGLIIIVIFVFNTTQVKKILSKFSSFQPFLFNLYRANIDAKKLPDSIWWTYPLALLSIKKAGF